MLSKNEEKLAEVRLKTIAVLQNLTASQKLVLQAMEACDLKSYEQASEPLVMVDENVEEIDNLIVHVFARYAPEAKDLREMVSFLKITSSLQRIAINEKNYIKNMQICQPDMEEEMKRVINESLSINRNTIKALEFVMEMVKTTDDAERLKDLASKINVQNSKSDDIYTMIEKDALQSMHQEGGVNEEMINLLKYIRKNAKILDRLEDIASRLLFARIGGKL